MLFEVPHGAGLIGSSDRGKHAAMHESGIGTKRQLPRVYDAGPLLGGRAAALL